MNYAKIFATGMILGAVCAGIWFVMDKYIFDTVASLSTYIAVTCAYAAGYSQAKG